MNLKAAALVDVTELDTYWELFFLRRVRKDVCCGCTNVSGRLVYLFEIICLIQENTITLGTYVYLLLLLIVRTNHVEM